MWFYRWEVKSDGWSKQIFMWEPEINFNLNRKIKIFCLILIIVILQVRIPSKTDKPGGSPVRQTTTQVRNRRWHTEDTLTPGGPYLTQVLYTSLALAGWKRCAPARYGSSCTSTDTAWAWSIIMCFKSPCIIKKSRSVRGCLWPKRHKMSHKKVIKFSVIFTVLRRTTTSWRMYQR